MFSLRLLGGCALRGPRGPVEGPAAQPVRLALLAVLAVPEARPVSRDELVALLWPGHPAGRGRRNLSDTLYVLRQELGTGAIRSPGDALRLDPGRVRTDVERFAEALGRGDPAGAVEAYGGPFLQGAHLRDSAPFEHWADRQRQRLKRQYVRALESLAKSTREEGDPAAEVGWRRRIVAERPYSTAAAVALMRALERSGDPGAAIRAGQLHRERLAKELDVEPGAALEEEMGRIRRSPASAPARDAPESPPAAGEGQERRVEAGAPTPTEPGAPGSGSSRHRTLAGGGALMAAAAVLLALLLGLWGLAREGTGGPRGDAGGISPAGGDRSIAVLPFRDLSPRSGNDHLVHGMHEAVLTSLASLEGLLVTTPASVQPYADTVVRPERIARELGVKHLLMGSVQRAGERVRVTARLVEAETGRQLWARQFERSYSATDLFGIQSRVALATARALDVRLSQSDTRRVARRPTGSIDAYDYYLRGRERLGFVVGEVATDRRRIEQAIGLFREALARDPAFARPYVGLARAYAELAEMEGDGPWRDSVRAAARRALELAPGLPDAHLALAEVHRSGDGPGDLAAYHRAIRRALELSPGHPRATLEAARGWWRAAFRGSSRLDQVYCWTDRAARLEPSDPELLRSRAFGALAIGRYETAEEAARAALELEPDGLRIYRILVRAALLQSDRDAAEAYYRTARTVASSSVPDLAALGAMEVRLGLMDSARVHLEPLSEHVLGRFHQEEIALAYALWRTGRRDRAASILAAREAREREALGRGAAGFHPAVNLARIHAVRGETDAAVDAMGEAVERGWRHVARIGPGLGGPLQALWGRPGFDALMGQVSASVDSMRRLVRETGCDALRELPEPRAR